MEHVAVNTRHLYSGYWVSRLFSFHLVWTISSLLKVLRRLALLPSGAGDFRLGGSSPVSSIIMSCVGISISSLSKLLLFLPSSCLSSAENITTYNLSRKVCHLLTVMLIFRPTDSIKLFISCVEQSKSTTIGTALLLRNKVVNRYRSMILLTWLRKNINRTGYGLLKSRLRITAGI